MCVTGHPCWPELSVQSGPPARRPGRSPIRSWRLATGPRRTAPSVWLRGQAAWVLCHLPSEEGCPHRSMTAWIVTAVASNLSPQSPVWKRGSERNAQTRASCDWSTSWYVPHHPDSGLPASFRRCCYEVLGSCGPGVPDPVPFSSRTLGLTNM